MGTNDQSETDNMTHMKTNDFTECTIHFLQQLASPNQDP
jgi:hypothetical protein